MAVVYNESETKEVKGNVGKYEERVEKGELEKTRKQKIKEHMRRLENEETEKRRQGMKRK